MNTSVIKSKKLSLKVYSALVHSSRLKQARLNIGFTQREVAGFLGVYESQFSLYENAKSEMPLHFIFTLAQLYGVSTDYLLGVVDVPASSVDRKLEKHELKLLKQKLLEFV